MDELLLSVLSGVSNGAVYGLVGLGLVIIALGLFSTGPRALRSAARLAPLIAGPQVRLGGAHVKP